MEGLYQVIKGILEQENAAGRFYTFQEMKLYLLRVYGQEVTINQVVATMRQIAQERIEPQMQRTR